MSDVKLLKSVAERGQQSHGRKPLQRFDWLTQALDTFVAEGIDAVRITRLAEDLGVTRGSFYWHFENREDLIAALVSYWKDKNTAAIIDSVRDADNLVDGILRFFETCVDPALFDPRLDLAIREWARRSKRVRTLVDAEDASRIEALCQFFSRFDYAMPQALIRARVLYFSQIGFYALEVVEPLPTRLSYTEAYYECFTGRELNPLEAEKFRRHIIETHGDSVS